MSAPNPNNNSTNPTSPPVVETVDDTSTVLSDHGEDTFNFEGLGEIPSFNITGLNTPTQVPARVGGSGGGGNVSVASGLSGPSTVFGGDGGGAAASGKPGV